MYQLAIFDLDGTLLDTIEDLKRACNYALEAHGYSTHDTASYKRFVGSGIYKLVERALPEEARDEANVLKVKATFDSYYTAHNEDTTKPYEGIKALLMALKARGIRCAVFTNKAEAYATSLVERQFGELISDTIGQKEGVPVKPHPIGIKRLLEKYQIAKEDCIYIGDSDIDILTAKNAEVTSVGVLWGFRTKEELQEAGANHLVATPKSLEALIVK